MSEDTPDNAEIQMWRDRAMQAVLSSGITYSNVTDLIVAVEEVQSFLMHGTRNDTESNSEPQ